RAHDGGEPAPDPRSDKGAGAVETGQRLVLIGAQIVREAGVRADVAKPEPAEMAADHVVDLVDLKRAGCVVQRRPVACSPARLHVGLIGVDAGKVKSLPWV